MERVESLTHRDISHAVAPIRTLAEQSTPPKPEPSRVIKLWPVNGNSRLADNDSEEIVAKPYDHDRDRVPSPRDDDTDIVRFVPRPLETRHTRHESLLQCVAVHAVLPIRKSGLYPAVPNSFPSTATT